MKSQKFKQLPIATIGNWVLVSDGKTDKFHKIIGIKIKQQDKEVYKVLITDRFEIDSRNGEIKNSDYLAKDKIKVSL